MLSSTFNEQTTGISPSSTSIKEGTLSYYFNLHNEGFFSACDAQHLITCTSSNVNVLPSYPKPGHHTKHGSSFSRQRWQPPLLDACESGAAPLSWLSALFSRRKKQHGTRSRHACFDEGKCEPLSTAHLEWEPPRASSWEQLSPWEKPSSSLWNLFAAEDPPRASDADMQELHPTISAQAAAEVDPLMKKREETSRKGQLQWMKNLLAIKWAIKLRRRLRKKRVAEQGRGDGAFQNGQIKAGQDRAFHSQRELGATWSSDDYSHLMQTYGSLQSYATLKPKRPSHQNLRDHGLLRFYLTPTRGIKIGSKRARNHHPLIPTNKEHNIFASMMSHN